MTNQTTTNKPQLPATNDKNLGLGGKAEKEVKNKVRCYNEMQHVAYPYHDIADNGFCLHCCKWFGWDENDDPDETVAYSTEEEMQDAR
jgi:hypothetical protein